MIGATYKIAAQYAGVGESSIMCWLEIARELQKKIDEGEKPRFSKYQKLVMEFSRRITEADNIDDINLLQVIDKAASSDPGWAEKRLRWKHRGAFEIATNIDLTTGGDKIQPTVIEIVKTYEQSLPPGKE